MSILNKDKRAERRPQNDSADVLQPDQVSVGDVYREKGTDDGHLSEVIPYFLDFGSNTVFFNNVGRSNEEQLVQDAFLRRFERVGSVNESSLAEPQKDFVPLKENEVR